MGLASSLAGARARLTAPCVSHARAEEDDADAADVSRVPADALRSVEADTYWCVSRLLDGIQVSARGGGGRGLSVTPWPAARTAHTPRVPGARRSVV